MNRSSIKTQAVWTSNFHSSLDLSKHLWIKSKPNEMCSCLCLAVYYRIIGFWQQYLVLMTELMRMTWRLHKSVSCKTHPYPHPKTQWVLLMSISVRGITHTIIFQLADKKSFFNLLQCIVLHCVMLRPISLLYICALKKSVNNSSWDLNQSGKLLDCMCEK